MLYLFFMGLATIIAQKRGITAWIYLALVLLLTVSLVACTPPSTPLPLPTTHLPPALIRISPSPAPLTPSPALLLTPSPLPASTTPAVPSTPEPTNLTPTPHPCWRQGGVIQTVQLEAEQLPAPFEFRVYTPPCYEQQPNQAYPVLYLIHGQSYTDDQWQRLGATTAADTLIAAGELPPFIIVMPRDRVWSEPAEDDFDEALVTLLLPWVDTNYHTLPDRLHRAVGGLSRGGAWALHLGLTHPDLFGRVGIHSGFAFNGDVPFIRIWLRDIPQELMPRFYLDVGDNDRPVIIDSAAWFERLLTEQNIPHEWHLFAGYHEEAYWQAHIEDYLRWYTSDW